MPESGPNVRPTTSACAPGSPGASAPGERGTGELWETTIDTDDIRGLLIDLDGTVYQGSSLIRGAAEAVKRLRSAGIPFLFTTNTSRKSRTDILAALGDMGLDARETDVFSAPVAAAGWLRDRGVRRVQLLLPTSTHADFAAFDVVEEEPEMVLVGDLGPGFTFQRLDGAFRSLRSGAGLVAIHRNRYWLPDTGPTLDAGPFVAALEYAAGVEATLVGKPSPAFFRTAAERTGIPERHLAVVGDDPESDVRGARAAGLRAIQVRTGKFREDDQATRPEGERPHLVVDSLAALPGLLGV